MLSIPTLFLQYLRNKIRIFGSLSNSFGDDCTNHTPVNTFNLLKMRDHFYSSTVNVRNATHEHEQKFAVASSSCVIYAVRFRLQAVAI